MDFAARMRHGGPAASNARSWCKMWNIEVTPSTIHPPTTPWRSGWIGGNRALPGARPLLRLGATMCGNRRQLGTALDQCREGTPKESQNVSELRSRAAMAAIHAFGPFRLDAEAEILFKGQERANI